MIYLVWKKTVCRGSYREKNQEIAPVMMPSDDPDRVMMIQIQWWWSNKNDPDPVMIQIQWWCPVIIWIEWWSRFSDDDPDPVMIQIQWWSTSSDDDPDPVMMIQIQWWSRSSDDDPDPNEDDLQMKMTWSWRWLWRWWRPNDDSDDTEKKTCVDKLCRENTFLVKRECWCNCNFGMYSLVFLIYCNPMFIPRFIVMYLSHVIPRCLFREVSIMRKSCQVIVANPPIGQGLKSP